MKPRDEEWADQIEIVAADKEPTRGGAVTRDPDPRMREPLETIVLHLDGLRRSTAENTAAISRLEAFTASVEALPPLVAGLQERLDKKDMISLRLFDSLHEELKGYKDGFLLEVLHKPLVRDLITLFDDLTGLGRQFDEEPGPEPARSREGPFIVGPEQQLGQNLQHIIGSLLELLARIDVVPMERRAGKLNKQTQRAVATQAARTPDDDRRVIQSVKQGFMWRDRVFRPEEVIIAIWTEGSGIEVPDGIA